MQNPAASFGVLRKLCRVHSQFDTHVIPGATAYAPDLSTEQAYLNSLLFVQYDHEKSPKWPCFALATQAN